jgi:hypothetical protein
MYVCMFVCIDEYVWKEVFVRLWMYVGKDVCMQVCMYRFVCMGGRMCGIMDICR